MSDAFVGFNSSQKLNPEANPRLLKLELALDRPVRDVLSSFSSHSRFESVFGLTKKFVFRQGAKPSFSLGELEYRGTISQISIPKRIVVNTEVHGEIELQFELHGSGTRILVSARYFLKDAETIEWEKSITDLGERLREV